MGDRELRPPCRAIDVPLSVRLKMHVSDRTRAELENIREALCLALAQASGDRNRQKFVPGLTTYRNAVDTVLSIEPPRAGQPK